MGIGGIDVHGFYYKLLGLIPLEIYPYKVQFRSIRTHLLLEEPLNPNLSFREAEKRVFSALSQARCFISNYSIGDGRGFRFRARHQNNWYTMGSRFHINGEVILTAESPLPGDIRLLKDSKEILCLKGNRLEYRIAGKGVYRIEVFRKRRGWIYSNPIVILE